MRILVVEDAADIREVFAVLLRAEGAVVAYLKDPGLPMVGVRNGLSLLWFVLPRLVPALILAGLMQVLVPQEVVARHFGQQGGMKSLLIASVAGVLTPGGPMVSVPLL